MLPSPTTRRPFQSDTTHCANPYYRLVPRNFSEQLCAWTPEDEMHHAALCYHGPHDVRDQVKEKEESYMMDLENPNC
jgi:hypothetical protein